MKCHKVAYRITSSGLYQPKLFVDRLVASSVHRQESGFRTSPPNPGDTAATDMLDYGNYVAP
jgi:hypothetical protein